MSCGRIIGIACLAISGISFSVGFAQEGHSRKSLSASLAERFAAMKDVFRRDESPRKKSSRSTPRASTPSKAGRPRYTAQRLPTAAVAQRTKKSSHKSMLPRIQVDDLLPDRLFGHKNAAADGRSQPQRNDVPRVARSQRKARVASSRPAVPGARRSPTSTRRNELDSALSELIEGDDASAAEPVAVQPPAASQEQSPPELPQETSSPPSSTSSNTGSDSDDSSAMESSAEHALVVPRNQHTSPRHPVRLEPSRREPFDLHQALLDEQADAEAELPEDNATEVADSAAEATDSNIAAEPIKAAEPAEAAEPIEAAEPVEVAEPIEVARPVEEAEPTETTEQELAGDVVPELPPELPLEPTVDDRDRAASKPIETEAADPIDADTAFSVSQSPRDDLQTTPATEPMDAPAQKETPSEPDILSSHRQAVIESHVEGPRRILVGREASYRVTLENKSGTPAESVSASVRIPEWAEVVDVMSTSGAVERSSEDLDAGALHWKLDELGAHSSETLQLLLIPRSGRALQLGVQWSQSSVGSETTVEVQEPKLQIAIDGPSEVRFGKPQRYRLTLRNPGTGLAEQVVLRLIPPGGDERSATTQNIGVLRPGQIKEMDLELTAREAGELLMQAKATAAGGLQAEVVKTVRCSKPELRIDWRGPHSKYVGAVAAYYFRVTNPGTAATGPVQVSVRLPQDAKLVTASEDHAFQVHNGVVRWRLTGLAPHEEQFLQMRCRVDRPGNNQFEVLAETSDGDLHDTKTIQTNVVALADLKLEVNDPQGAVPVGESALYVIRVNNRGTKAAHGVSIVGLFSEGIEPVSVEGAQYTIHDGRVTFHPINSLPAGREVLLKIRAEASQPGTHIFRAEVVCEDLDIKLSAEETTRFFQDEYRWEGGETPYTAERSRTIRR